jgi:hypothetical protein
MVLMGILGGAWGIWRWRFGVEEKPTIVLLDVRGEVQVEGGPGDTHKDAEVMIGSALLARDRLITGADGMAVLGFGEVNRVALSENGSIEVISADASGVRLGLEGGKVEAHIKAGSLGIQAGNREIVASDAEFRVLRDRSGVVAVQVDAGSGVSVSEGESTVAVAVGQRLVAAPETPLSGPVADSLLLVLESPPGGRTREPEIPLEGRTEPGAGVRVIGGSWSRETTAGVDGRFRVVAPLAIGQNRIRLEVRGVLGDLAAQEVVVIRAAGAIGVQISNVP